MARRLRNEQTFERGVRRKPQDGRVGEEIAARHHPAVRQAAIPFKLNPARARAPQILTLTYNETGLHTQGHVGDCARYLRQEKCPAHIQSLIKRVEIRARLSACQSLSEKVLVS